ncbi:interferon-induced protein 44-like isoform X2 [Ptychodera flava]
MREEAATLQESQSITSASDNERSEEPSSPRRSNIPIPQMLTQKDIEQLRLWLKRPYAQFLLIYKGSVDGFDPSVFHRLCDDKSDTITVAYNSYGYVFGGYTQIPWTSVNQGKQDNASFLFRLYSAHDVFDPFVRRSMAVYSEHQRSQVYHKASYGPSFGAVGSTLTLFHGPHRKGTNGFTKTNGFCQPGATGNFDYEKFEPHDLLGPNDFNFREIEVYQLTDSPTLRPTKTTSKQATSSRTSRDDEPPSLLSLALLHNASKPALVSPVVEAPQSRQSKGGLLPESEAWRGQHWDQQTRANLKQEIAHHRPLECFGVRQFRILMLGQIGAGKSSFFNTINSIYRGHVTSQANMGSVPHSLTTRFRTYEVRSSRGGDPLNFRLCDTMGLEETMGLDVSDIPYLLDGNIPDRYQFNPALRITPDIPGFISTPTLAEKIHCVVFVVDCSTVSVMSPNMIEKFAAIRTHVNQRGIPLIVLLTKIDTACPYVNRDLAFVYRSKYLREKVEEISYKLGLPRSSILPIKNYECELELETKVDILALSALRQMFRFADNFFDDQLDEISDHYEHLH